MIQASNRTAAISFDGHAVTITRHRNGFTQAGSRTIPLAQISALRWKPASTWSGAGYIKLVIAGTNERHYDQSKLLKTDLLKDENAVPFGKGQQSAFEAVKVAIENALGQLQAGHQPHAPGGSVADEILKLKQLVDAGALSPAEFEAAKARLLH